MFVSDYHRVNVLIDRINELLPDGTYRLVQRPEGEKRMRSQKWFLDHRGCWHGTED